MSTVDRILELVNESGLTAKDFANKAGLAGGSITDWKTGRSRPSVESLQKIAAYSKVQLEWLTGDSEFKTKKAEHINYINHKDRLEALELAKENKKTFLSVGLTEEQILEIVKALTPINTNYINELPNSKKIFKKIYSSFSQSQRRIVQQVVENYIRTLLLRTKKKLEQYTVQIPILGKIAAGQPILAEEYIEGYLPVDPNIYGVSTADDLFFLRIAGNSMNLKVKNGDYALIRKQDYAEDGDIVAVIVNSDDEATLKRYKKLNEQFVLLEPMSTDPSINSITVDLKTTKFQIIGKAIGQFGKF